jgi:hypothetical protein
VKAPSRGTDKTKQRGKGRTAFLPALVALGSGCGFLPGSAAALELGAIDVHSTLGQPLRASIAYALQPNEQLHADCVHLKPGLTHSGLPSVGRARVTVGNGMIRVTGQTVVREPLLALQLTVDCPRTAHLSRSYSIFIDRNLPAQQLVGTRAADSSRTVSSRHATAAATTSVPRAVTRPPLQSSGSYRVQPGESLSDIAARLSGRGVGIWDAVDAIFAANKAAFINNDRNLLRAGALLAIPDSIVSAQARGTMQPALAPASEPHDLASTAQRADSARTANAAHITPNPDAAVTTVSNTAATPRGLSSDTGSAQPTAGAPRPGDTLIGSDNPFVSPIDADINGTASANFAAPAQVLPQSAVEEAASSAAVPVGRSETASGRSLSGLAWPGGIGIALIFGLLLFGRRLKERLQPDSVNGSRGPDATDTGDIGAVQATGGPAAGTARVARMVSLDADPDDGSGFPYGDIDVAQDFGVSADSGQIQQRLDMGSATYADDRHQTDVIAPRRMEEATILVSEVPPQHDDTGEYDLSMVVDATKPILDDAYETAQDLHAIEVTAEEDGMASGEYTVSKDVDYRVLEQDYEDELTATQALDAEIARAAQALSQQYGKDEMGDTMADTIADFKDGQIDAEFEDQTSQPPFTEDPPSVDDLTTAIPATVAARGMDDTTHLAISSTTMSLDDTANEEIALEVPAAENDSTVEAENESAPIGSMKKRAY